MVVHHVVTLNAHTADNLLIVGTREAMAHSRIDKSVQLHEPVVCGFWCTQWYIEAPSDDQRSPHEHTGQVRIHSREQYRQGEQRHSHPRQLSGCCSGRSRGR